MRLLWLQVQLIGKAQRAWCTLLRRLNCPTEPLYYLFMHVLSRVAIEICMPLPTTFGTMERKDGETWADFSDSLKKSADLAFPELDKIKEAMSIQF